MKYLFHTLDRFRVNNVLMVLRVKTDGTTLYATLRMPNDEAMPEITVTLGYGGVTKTMTRTSAYKEILFIHYSLSMVNRFRHNIRKTLLVKSQQNLFSFYVVIGNGYTYHIFEIFIEVNLGIRYEFNICLR